ncbi:DUF6531 domain-containing protein [Streptomyces xiamenensis]|uniref:DUF6531 domain-containing protein n=1 Tax=Streptomyces xiamenensis TaxID=408015 RepID=UPI0036E330F2
MGRGSDWSPVGMDSDPTPGDPERVEELADKLLAFADDVAEAQDKLRNLMGDGLLDSFVGETANAFGEQMEDVPPNLAKLHESHELAGEALAAYWPKLRQAQADADRALEDAVEAQSDLTSAESWLATAASSLETAQDEAEPPDEGEVRAEVRRALTDAENDHEDAQSAVTGAQGRLDAAKLLAQQAKEAREEAASLCVSDLRTASDAGIKNKRWWEKVVDWVADNWDTIVQVAQIIGTIVGIAALFIGGPLIAGILLAVALVALADTLVKYSKGEASLWDVGFAVLDVLPGGRLLGAGARTARTGLRDTATTVRGERPQIRQDGRRMDSRNECGDPVDVATGELVMSATDITLPGVLPLVLERHHISTYGSGRWFGRSWASTLDQRLRLDDYGVRFYSADGMILNYPIPLADPDHPVLPTEGPRWGLLWDGNPETGMRVHQRETGRTLHFAPHPTRPGPDLRLSAITDRNSNRITVHYDERGVPAELEHTGGYRIHIATYEDRITALHLASDPERPLLMSYGYDADGNLSEIYNSSGLPLRFSYDNRARLTRWEDRNHTWYRYEYDAEGRVVFSTGTERALEYRYAYEPEHHRTTATNSLGHDTLYQFNDSLQLIAETDPLGNTTHRTWDRYDRPLTSINPLGHITRYRYGDSGNVVTITRPDGHESNVRYDAAGRPIALTDPSGAVWRQDFDCRGNRTDMWDPAGNHTRYTYEANGSVSSATNALGHIVRIISNSAGLPTAVSNSLGETTQYLRNSLGQIVSLIDPMGARTRMHWTPEGKPLHRIDSQGNEERWTWDGEGNLLSHKNEIGAEVRYMYGPFDLPISQLRADGAEYLFERDSDLNLLRVTDPAGRHWDYVYDESGRLTSESDFDGRVTTYGYDAAGQVTSRTNPCGSAIDYSYDNLGRLSRKNTTDGTVTSYEHDLAGHVIWAANEHSVLKRRYDRAGNMVSEEINGSVVSLEYDVIGRLTKRTTPSGHESVWTYDTANQPISLSTGRNELNFQYDPAGREVSRLIGAHMELTQNWNPLHRLTSQTLTRSDATESVPEILGRQYSYRSDGYQDSLTEAGSRTRYELDPSGRVMHVNRDGQERSESYAYDRSGNQTAAHWADLSTHEAAGERQYRGSLIIRAGRTRYEHDAAGRTILRQQSCLSRKPRSWRYVWDAEGRLSQTRTPDGTTWRYVYDPFDRRIAKQQLTADGSAVAVQTDFTWHGIVLIEQRAGRNHIDASRESITWDHIGLRPVTQTHTSEIDQKFYAIITDLVGTPTHLFQEDGSLAWHNRAVHWGSGPSTSSDIVEAPLRFPGQYADEETGWHYNYFRHYDPDIARYTSSDPLGLSPAPNAYTYVHNPQSWIDPMGLSPHPPELSGVGDKQFGKKWGKHSKDYGLDPGDASARAWFENRIHEVHSTPDDIRQGPWNPGRGGGDDYWFFHKENDLVVTRGDGAFVTMFPMGEGGNGWYNSASPRSR